MKAGYHGNAALQQRLERADSGVRPIVQAVVTTAEDIIDTKSEWMQADSYADFDVLDIGAIRLKGSGSTHISQTTNDTNLTSLKNPHNPPFDVAVIEWAGFDTAEHTEIHSIIARLNPNTGAGQNVATWKCQVWRLARIGVRESEAETAWELEPIATGVGATAGGVTADVTFDFSGYDVSLSPGPAPEILPNVDPSDAIHRPTTIIQIWGIQDDGSAATNTAWRADSSAAQKVISGHIVSHKVLAELDTSDVKEGGTAFEAQTGTACPYLVIRSKSYTAKTITFSSNPIDLGSTSYDTLECVTRDAEFGGSAVAFQIASTSSTYYSCADGDVIGADNSTAGGYDLTGLAERQKYKMRATLTPSTDGQVTPAVYAMGVRNITKTDLDGLVNVGGCRWAVDPVSLKGEIPELRLEFLRDGILDYRDAATQLLSANHVDKVEYDLWLGHPDLDRRRWLFIDRFVEDDRETAGAGINLTCVSRLANLREEVPPIVNSTGSTSVKERRPVEYSGTAKSIYDDLIGSQIALPDRYIGPGIESTRAYSRNLTDIRPGKNYLDQIAYLEGGSVISSQGRLKFVSFYGTDVGNPNSTGLQSGPVSPVRARFPQEEIQELSITPGFGSRITEWTVFHGWDDDRDNGRGAYTGEVRRSSTAIIEQVGRALINVRTSEDKDTCQWIQSSTAGSTSADWLARRQVERFGHGLILWTLRSTYPKPWLEPGDVVSVESDRMVARDPYSDKPIRGRNWAKGRVVCVHDVMGTQFTIWVESYSDITGSQTQVDWTHYTSPEIRDIAAAWSTGGKPTYLVMTNRDAASVKVAESASTYPNKAAVRTETAHAMSTNRDASWTSTNTYAVGDKVWLSGLAYETSTGGGAESVYLYKKQITRDNVPNMSITPVFTGTTQADVSAIVHLNSLANSFKLAVNTRSRSTNTNFPATTDVRASTMAWAGSGSVDQDTIGTLATLSYGQVADIAGLAYASTAWTGQEGPLVKVTASPFPPAASVGTNEIIDGGVVADKMIESARRFITDIEFNSTANDSIYWSSGFLEIAGGKTYTISASTSHTLSTTGVYPYIPSFVYFASTSSTSTLSMTNSLSAAVADGRIFLATAWAERSNRDKATIIPTVGMLRLNSTNLNPNILRTEHLRALQVTADKIAANAITAAKIDAAAVTAAKIAALTVSSCHIDTGTLRIESALQVGADRSTDFSGFARFYASLGGSSHPHLWLTDLAEGDNAGLSLSTDAADCMDLVGRLRVGVNDILFDITGSTGGFTIASASTSGGDNGTGQLSVRVNGQTRYLSFDT